MFSVHFVRECVQIHIGMKIRTSKFNVTPCTRKDFPGLHRHNIFPVKFVYAGKKLKFIGQIVYPYHKPEVILHKILVPAVNHGGKFVPRSADYHALFMQA